MFNHITQLKRRAFLRTGSVGVGAFALSSLLSGEQTATASGADRWTGVIDELHYPARAKRVIFLVMAGGPSHLETFDYKPKLAELDGQPMPESFTKGQPIAQVAEQAN